MIKLQMPSGIYYQIPVKLVEGKRDKLRTLFQIILSIEAKAEKIKKEDKLTIRKPIERE